MKHGKLNDSTLEYTVGQYKIYYDLHVDYYSPDPYVEILDALKNLKYRVSDKEFSYIREKYYNDILTHVLERD